MEENDRTAFLRELKRATTRKGSAQNGVVRKSVNNILVIQLTKMGDILQTTPLLHRIRAHNPDAGISLLIDSKQIELASNIPFIDRMIPLDLASIYDQINKNHLPLSKKYEDLRGQLEPLQREHFDRIYNLNFSKITTLLCQFFPMSEVIGYRPSTRPNQILKESWVSFIFHLMRNRNLIRLNLVDLLAAYENDNSLPSRHLFYGKESQRSFADEISLLGCGKQKKIGFQLGCGGYLRRWPISSFASLAHRLVTQHHNQIILLGGKGEENLGKQFEDEWFRLAGKNPVAGTVIDLIGKTTLPQLAGALEKCDLLISADTGTMHLATAVGTRVLALFLGTALCHETGPYGEGHYVIQAQMPCSPCSEGACQRPICQQLIRPEMVSYLVSSILEEKEKFSPPEFLGEGANRITSRQDVQVYRSEVDPWGVKFLPLIPRYLEIDDLMAGVYREVGRKLMYAAYPIRPESLVHEFSCFYRRITDEGRERVGEILKNLEMAQSSRGEGTVSPDPGERIAAILGSQRVLAPLYGLFQDLGGGRGENCSGENKYQALLAPIKACMDLLNCVYQLPSAGKLLPNN